MDCMDTDTEPLCASDLGTYDGSCDMKTKVCEMYARHHLEQGNLTEAEKAIENITITGNQPCPSKNINSCFVKKMF